MINFTRNYILLILSFAVGCMFTSTLLTMTTLNKCTRNEEKTPSNEYHELFLIVLVMSAHKNNIERNAIRDTWASLKSNYINYGDKKDDIINIPEYNTEGFLEPENVEMQRKLLENYKTWITEKSTYKKEYAPHLRIKVVFSIGTEDLDKSSIQQLQDEQHSHNDIIFLSDFKDHYRNLTCKLIESIRELVDRYKFKYLLKCDDDTYVKLNLLAQDLYYYDSLLEAKHSSKSLRPDYYWGYFNGRAQLKTHGQWTEKNFNLAKNYLPYALGGGYVISYGIVKFIYNHEHTLSTYVSEDISMGVWTAPFSNIHRRHDVRFDTGYMARQCNNYHLLLHKRTAQDMYDIYNGNLCSFGDVKTKVKRPKEYFYDWSKSPTECCDNWV